MITAKQVLESIGSLDEKDKMSTVKVSITNSKGAAAEGLEALISTKLPSPATTISRTKDGSLEFEVLHDDSLDLKKEIMDLMDKEGLTGSVTVS